MKKVILILIGVLVVNFLMGLCLNEFYSVEAYKNYYILKILIKISLIALVIFLIYKEKNITAHLKNNVFIIPLILVLLFLSFEHVYTAETNIPTTNTILFFISCISVGIFEEILFRVYLFSKLNKLFNNNILKSAMVASALFGVAHATGFFKEDVLKITVFVQIVLAFGIGIVLQALYIRFKNVLLVITLHGIINFIGTYTSKLLLITSDEPYTNQDFIISMTFSIVVTIILFAISYYIIRPIHKKHS